MVILEQGGLPSFFTFLSVTSLRGRSSSFSISSRASHFVAYAFFPLTIVRCSFIFPAEGIQAL